ncbi:NnrS family protein [Uliginosibacterium sp. sgz301328]|uniref:NnrS family protein n=1 Tax=Uliginosibacterium sp. sgz301328 TaxID=3243764 RepID=UPI00359D6CB1
MAVIVLQEPRRKTSPPAGGCALFALGFRPFYLLAAIGALLLIPTWVAGVSGALAFSPAVPMLVWHGHEMVFGFAVAVIIGFLYTAARNWTGLATPRNGALAALCLLWLAGRVTMLTGPLWLAAAVNLAFLPAASIPLARVLIRARARRNYFVLGILTALWLADATLFGTFFGWVDMAFLDILHAAIAVITLLETVIGGRIIPGFTANATKQTTARHAPLDQAAILFTALALLGWALQVAPEIAGILAVVAALLQIWRSSLWRPLATLRHPLLWSLHVSHGWIAAALLLIASQGLGLVNDSVVTHTLTVGAMAGLILAMITRTALGHTGRMLRAGPAETAIYSSIVVAVLARVVPPLVWPEQYLHGLWLAAAAWSAAFALYLWRYAPMLWRPRADGMPD